MRKNVIVLDKSTLSQNVCRILLEKTATVESAVHLEDIDVFLREQDYDLIIINENLCSLDDYKKLVARNPELEKIKKIYISNSGESPAGFKSLKRPFEPSELIRLVEKG